MRPTLVRRVLAAFVASALAVVSAAVLAPAASAATPPALHPGDRYVALGDSYASGSGVGPLADHSCLRSTLDYPALLAQRLGLDLTDVTCSAATIPNMIDTPQQTLGGTTVPAQVQAVTSDTRLVTITAGGNDVALFLDMVRFSCAHDPATVANAPNLPAFVKPVFCAPADRAATTAALARVGDDLGRLIGAVRVRAPQARIVLTDYLDVVPLTGPPCAHVPLIGDELSFLRTTQARLSLTIAATAQRTGTRYAPVALLGATHDACASVPWTNRFVFGDYAQVGLDAYHPNIAGNVAVADSLRPVVIR